MKTRIRSFIFLACLLVAGIALAQVVTTTEQLVRIQTDPATGRVQAFFEKSVTIEGVSYKQPWTEVSWAIGADKMVTVGEKTYTYAEVLAAAQAIAEQEKAAQAAPPLEPEP